MSADLLRRLEVVERNELGLPSKNPSGYFPPELVDNDARS